MMIVVVALAGGLGAVARFALDGWLRARWSRRPDAHPPGTMIINLSGSLLLGLLAGLVLSGAPATLQSVAGTGFCGGYTTFSTACVEVVRLLGQRRWGAAATQGLGTLVGAGLLALLGLTAGLALGR